MPRKKDKEIQMVIYDTEIKADQQAACVQRMIEEEFTLQDIIAVATANGVELTVGGRWNKKLLAEKLADNLIQKFRRGGIIASAGRRGHWVWKTAK